jgi:hypothetical protein
MNTARPDTSTSGVARWPDDAGRRTGDDRRVQILAVGVFETDEPPIIEESGRRGGRAVGALLMRVLPRVSIAAIAVSGSCGRSLTSPRSATRPNEWSSGPLTRPEPSIVVPVEPLVTGLPQMPNSLEGAILLSTRRAAKKVRTIRSRR